MNINDILNISNGIIINGSISNNKIKNIKIDSRKIKKNDVFVCIKGKNTDGHNYINDVLKKCSCIIVEKDVDVNSNALIIKVKNTIEFLYILGLYIRNRYINVPLIAITGSCGKTTTKELLAHVLRDKYNILYTKGNNNNNIGVPLTLFNLNENYNLIILELGMNHLKEISRLSKLVKPNISIITNIGTSHIGNLGSLKKIYIAKKEILDGMIDGILIIGNDKYLNRIKSKKVNVYGIKDCEIKNVICNENLYFTLIYKNKKYNIEFNIPNKSLINNILVVIKTCLLFNLDIEDIIEKLKTYKTLGGRSNIIKLKDRIIIDDCYNASFESMLGSIDMLKNYEKKLIILGDILELGKYSKKIHMKLAKNINEKCLILTVGENMKLLEKYCNSINFSNNQDLINYLDKMDLKDYYILIKGSHGMNLNEIKNYLIKKS